MSDQTRGILDVHIYESKQKTKTLMSVDLWPNQNLEAFKLYTKKKKKGQRLGLHCCGIF